MSEPYVGEIRMFAGNFAPRGWAFCDGQLQAISQNDALFSLVGTTYGGDGQNTFGLPDLRGRIPIHAGSSPGGSTYILGARGGSESVTLTTAQLPSHSHQMMASDDPASETRPEGNALAGDIAIDIYRSPIGLTNFNQQAISPVGGSQSHTNVQPFLCINFIISLFGIYPSRQ